MNFIQVGGKLLNLDNAVEIETDLSPKAIPDFLVDRFLGEQETEEDLDPESEVRKQMEAVRIRWLAPGETATGGTGCMTTWYVGDEAAKLKRQLTRYTPYHNQDSD